MKNRNILLILATVLAGLFLTGCNSSDEPEILEAEFSPQAGPAWLHEISNDDMYAILNDTSGEGIFVYIGMSTCPFCQEFQPILSETLEYLNRGLYHFEADTAALIDDESIMPMFEILTSMIEQTDGAWEGGGVPAMIYLVDGEVINFMVGIRTKEEVIEFFEMDHFNDRTWNIVVEVDVDQVDWLPEVGLTYVTSDELYDILADMSNTGFFVYIGTPSCPFCRQFEPILVETLEELNLGLRYWQVDNAFEVEEELANEVFSNMLGQTRWNGGVPVIKFIANGHVVDFLSGVQDSEAVTEFFERNNGFK